jgi:hypothetical protein
LDFSSLSVFERNKSTASVSLGLPYDGSLPFLTLNSESGSDRAQLSISDNGPLLKLADSAGFSSAVGTVDLVTTRTGEQHKTSAASLVLFGKDGKVLWSAP